MRLWSHRVLFGCCLLLACLMPSCGVLAQAARIVYVNQSAPAGGLGDGSSWASAYRELRDAINAVSPSGNAPIEIWVAKGVYKPTGTSNRADSFVLKSHLTIRGGFAGSENTLAQRTGAANATILSGDIGRVQASAVNHANLGSAIAPDLEDPGFTDNSYNVLLATNVVGVTLENLVIASGCANVSTNEIIDADVESMGTPSPVAPGTTQFTGAAVVPLDRRVAGGGLFVYSDFRPSFSTEQNDITVLNCFWVNNYARGYGGAVAGAYTVARFLGGQFLANASSWEGGAMWLQNSWTDVLYQSFEQNQTLGSGGAIHFQAFPSELTLPPPFADQSQFERAYGMSREDFGRMVAMTASDMKVMLKIADTRTMIFKFNRVVGQFKEMFTSRPLTPDQREALTEHRARQARFTTAERWFDRAETAKFVIDVGVMIGDYGVALAGALGANTNNASTRGWMEFSYYFHTYCTPDGLTGLAAARFIEWFGDVTGLTQAAEDAQFDKRVDTLRRMQLHYYNQGPYSTVLQCDFWNNQAGSAAGAVSVNHENVHFEANRFIENEADSAGALLLSAYTTPVLLNNFFLENYSPNNHSAIANVSHARSQMINNTFLGNRSGSTNGFAVGNELGSEVRIANSVFWWNTNPEDANLRGGADIFTATRATLPADMQSRYTDAKEAYGDLVAICDIANSCVQSLDRLPEGTDNYMLFPDGQGFETLPTGVKVPRPFTQAEIDARVRNLREADRDGTHESRDLVNLGEGNRPGLRTRKGNISTDPLIVLSGGRLVPSMNSPVINRGATNRLYNGIIAPLGDADNVPANRVVGGQIDMGAFEYQGGTVTGLGYAGPSGAPPGGGGGGGGGGEEAGPRYAGIMYVDPAAASGNNTGTSWANAKRSLQDALTNRFEPGAEIWVKAGTYIPQGGVTASFRLPFGAALYGGFAGGETSRDQRDWVARPTILDGNAGSPSSDADNCLSVVTAVNVDFRTRLDGFTIRGGRGTSGGGLRTTDAYPTIVNCLFTDNQATSQGGAAYSSGDYVPGYTNCRFVANSAGSGGAIASSGMLDLKDCEFTSNTATAQGGAIFAGYTWLQRCKFMDNTAGTSGGAVHAGNGDGFSAENCLFARNRLTAASTSGGAVTVAGMDATFRNCTFANNTAAFGSATQSGAGALRFSGLTADRLEIESCIFHGNRTSGGGSAPTLERQQIMVSSQSTVNLRRTLVEGIARLDDGESRNLDVDPLFVDPAGGDFQLQSASAAIDAGDTSTGGLGGVLDLGRQNRKVRARVDLGAYEFQGTPTPVAYGVALTRLCEPTGPLTELQLNLEGHPAPSTYTWQVNRNDGNGFVNLDSNPVYQGDGTARLRIVNPPTSMDGWRYRVRGTGAAIFTSTEARLWAPPSRIYVKANATGANTGADWANAYTSLAAALDVAQPCSQIWVAQGTYTPTSGSDTNIAFKLRSGVSIYGGFAGYEYDLSQRRWRDHPTVLSANINDPARGDDDSANLFYNFGLNAEGRCDRTAVLDGFILRGARGAAIVNRGAGPTLRNCAFTGNRGPWGSAIENSEGAYPLIVGCTFTNNQASDGVVRSSDSTVEVFNSLFAGNTSDFRAGAMAAYRSTTRLVNCTIANNTADSMAGGLYLDQGTLELKNVILWGNRANGPYVTVSAAQLLEQSHGPANITITNSCIQGGTSLGSGNTAFDPLFLDPAAGNFALSAFSPAVDAGDPASAAVYATDLAGVARVFGAGPDMGAFELQSAAAASPIRVSSPLTQIPACDGGSASFSVGSADEVTFVWQMQNPSTGAYVDIAAGGIYAMASSASGSGRSSTLTISPASVSLNGRKVRFRIDGTAFASAPLALRVQSPTRIYVNASATGGATGGSWADAFPNLQVAIRAARDAGGCAELWVAGGTYTAVRDAYNETAFQMAGSVAWYGGFAGNETYREARNPVAHPTILTSTVVPSPGTGGTVVEALGTAVDATAIMDGFIVQGSPGVTGVSVLDANPVFSNCIIRNNPRNGVMIWRARTSPTPAFMDCTFSGQGESAVLMMGGNPTFTRCTFNANGNGTQRSGGGAVSVNESTPTFDQCVFSNNISGFGGGAVYGDAKSTPAFTACRFVGNYTTGGGGALALYGGGSARNSLFANNVSLWRGGAVYHAGAGLSLIHCTIADNQASISGGGLYSQGSGVVIRNSILWNNRVPSIYATGNLQDDQFACTSTPVVTASVVEGLSGFPGVGNLGYAPLFADPEAGDYSLVSASPAIDAGDNAYAASGSPDLAGSTRIRGTKVDLGASEFQGTPTTPVLMAGLPASVSACDGSSAVFTVVAASGTPVVTWQRRVTASTYANVTANASTILSSSGRTNTLTLLPVAIAQQGQVYRALIDLGGGTFTTAPFTLTVRPPSVIYVNVGAAGANDGSSWANAHTNIFEAILAADACSEVWVAAGTYQLGVGSVPDTLYMRPGVRIYGGFAGTETQRTDRDPAAHVTTIRAKAGREMFANIALYMTLDASSILDGFTLSGASGVFAMVNSGRASPLIRNCVFTGNADGVAYNHGGAAPVFENCTFRDNVGPPFIVDQAATTIRDSVIRDNLPGNATSGGLVVQRQSLLTLENVRFINLTNGWGAVLSVTDGATSIVNRCEFRSNRAGVDGGAVYLSDAVFHARDSLFALNRAGSRGGAIANYRSAVSLLNCTLTENDSGFVGGGVYMQGGSVSAVNSIFWRNTDRNGTAESAQILNDSLGVGTLAVRQSCVQGLSNLSGNGNIGYDPLFEDVAGGNFALGLLSPLVNAGDTAAATGQSLDLAASQRVRSSAIDLGAYERFSTSGSSVALLERPATDPVCEGNTARFTIRGLSGATFEWFEGTETSFAPLTLNATQSVVTSADSSTLVIANPTLAMDGRPYLVRAQASGGHFLYIPVTLGVRPRSVIYVKADAAGAGTGANWTDALPYLDEAIRRATSCDEIWVSAGDYRPGGRDEARKHFRMKGGVPIYGGFAGTETDRSQRNPALHIARLLPWTDRMVVQNAGVYGAVDRTAVLDGFTIDGENAKWGFFNDHASPTIRNCVVMNVTSGLINDYSAPLITDSVVSNTVDYGVLVRRGSIEASNVLFIANGSKQEFGAIENDAATVIVRRCRFESNTSLNGGAIDNVGGSVFVENSSFVRNQARDEGGAIATRGGSVEVVNSTFVGNYAWFGGAVANRGQLLLRNCTLGYNDAKYYGGGIYQYSGTATLRNTIVWGHLQNSYSGSLYGAQINTQGGTVALANSLVQGYAGSANGNLAYDPLFVDGPAGDFHLMPQSPAANAGDNAFIGDQALDIAGNARIAYSTVDIGAFEATPVASPVLLLAAPASQSICAGSPVQFRAQGASGTTYQWQFSTDGGSSWSPIVWNGSSWTGPAGHSVTTGDGTSTLNITSATFAMNGYKYRVALLGSSFFTSPATLTVVQPDIIYVNAAAAVGGNGSSWGTAFNNLQDALNAANGCRREIWVTAGTYAPPIVYGSARPFVVPAVASGIELYGGFTGSETQRSQRDPSAHPSILSGDAGTPGDSSDDASIVMYFANASASVLDRNTVLDGFTFAQASSYAVGCYGTSPVIRNCRFTSLTGSTAILVSEGSKPLIEGCVIEGGSFSSAPIAIWGGYNGGNSDVAIVRTTIRGNTSSSRAGAVLVTANSTNTVLRMTNCVVSGNHGAYVGGVQMMGGYLQMVNCTVSGNRTPYYNGGAVDGYAGYTGGKPTSFIEVRNSILWGNRSAGNISWRPAGTWNALEVSQVWDQYATAGFPSVSIANSCVEGLQLFAGNGNSGLDPLFTAPLGAVLAPALGGDFHLPACSPLLNLGSASAIAGTSTDREDQPRSVGVVDMGAFEFQGTAGTALSITTHPTDIHFCESGANQAQVTASGGVAYQWQVDYGHGSGFENLSDGALFSGTTTSTLTLLTRSPGLNGLKIRCAVTGTSGCTAVSRGAALVVSGGRWYVNANAPAGGDGLSWSTAFRSLQEALTSSQLDSCGSEIWVAEGTYFASASDRQASIPLRSRCLILGGFAGTETAASQRDPNVHPTVFSGDIGVAGDDQDNTITLFQGTAAVSGAIGLDGLIFERAQKAFNLVASMDVTFSNCAFRNMSAGVLYAQNNTVRFQHCSITGSAGASTGVVYGYNATLVATDSRFLSNTSTPINAYNSTVTVARCEFRGNTASYGSGVMGTTSTVDIRDSLFSGNVAGTGSAITQFNPGVRAFTVRNCTIVANRSSVYGGAFRTEGTFSIYNTIVWGNTGGNSTATDPVFDNPIRAVDAPSVAGDFHLSPCSPLINTGDDAQAGGPDFDLSGAARKAGTVDPGAYEYQGTPAAALQVTSQPSATTFCWSSGSAFTVAATGTGLSYQWEVSADGGATFTALTDDAATSGTATATLTLAAATLGMNGYQYRCTVTSSAGCHLWSSAAVLTVYPQRWYVNGAAATGGDGLSWATAFRSLGEVLLDPNLPNYAAGQNPKLITGCGVEIWVAEGAYAPTTMLSLHPGVAIYGGFAGNETLLGQRDPVAHPTILSGNAGTPANAADDIGTVFSTIFRNSALDATSRLDGLILQDAESGLSLSRPAGSSVVHRPTIANCTFRSISREAIYNPSGASPTIASCTFSNLPNNAIVNYGGESVISGCRFADVALFGVLENSGSHSTVDGCEFTHCRTAILADHASTALIGSLFTANTNASMSVLGGSVTAKSSRFLGNNYTAVTLSGTTLTFENCLFAGNYSASSAGAISSSSSVLVLRNCTVVGNRSGTSIGGIAPSGQFYMFNSVLWGNTCTAFSGVNAQYYGSYSGGANNWIEGTGQGSPMFMDERQGPSAPTTEGDYRLSPCSPLINAGSNSEVTMATDLAGGDRQFAGGIVDIGAYEVEGTAEAPPTISTQPANAVGDEASPASFTVVASGTGLSYQWQQRHGSGAYLDLAENATFTGVTTGTLAVAGTPAMSGDSFRCIVRNSSGCPLPSSAAVFNYGLSLAGALETPGRSWTVSSAGWAGVTDTTHDGEDAAASALVGGAVQQSWIETPVTGPATVSFWWKVSSRQDYVEFYPRFDGVATSLAISGDVDWEQRYLNIGSGQHTLRWTLFNYGSGGLTNRAWLDQVVILPDPALVTNPAPLVVFEGGSASFSATGVGLSPHTYQWQKDGSDIGGASATMNFFSSGGSHMATNSSHSYTLNNVQASQAGVYGVRFTSSRGSTSSPDVQLTVLTSAQVSAAIEAPVWPWSSGGAASWFIQSAVKHDGATALQSGATPHAGESWVQATFYGPGDLSFWWKVSSEPGTDALQYFIDGVQQPESLSGDADWSQVSARIPQGQHTVRWRYTKDGSGSAGQDAGWLDGVVFTPDASVTFVVSNTSDSGAGSLRQAIIDGNLAPTLAVIDATGITGTLSLSSWLPLITNRMQFVGPGAASLTVSGGGQNRVFFVDAPGKNVVFQDLTIADGRAKGGNGGPRSGGGAGLGGGIFVNAGRVKAERVAFANNSAIGGTGGVAQDNGSGGGGGLGGDGGGAATGTAGGGGGGFSGKGGGTGTSTGGGGGGFLGDGANGGPYGSGGGGGGLTSTSDSFGAPGTGGGSGGYSSTRGADGSLYGGGGGGGSSSPGTGAQPGQGGRFGGGGGAGYSFTSTGASGGNGGEFGGGGGLGIVTYNNTVSGGTGGFGGGGGGGAPTDTRIVAGSGGFGGGGGAGPTSGSRGAGGAFGGSGGYGNTSLGGGGGGGGAALGGAVFVRPGHAAELTLVDCVTDAGTVTAGAAGSTTAQAGTAAGSAFFLGDTTNAIVVTTGTQTLSGSIAGWSTQPPTFVKRGAGTLVLAQASTLPGRIEVQEGALLVNATVNAPSNTVVQADAILGGTGTLGAVRLESGSSVAPGASVGQLNLGATTWIGQGNLLCQMLNATGAAGTGWDLLNITGALDLSTLTGLTVKLQSLSASGPDAAGDAANFNANAAGSWKIVQTTGGITGFNASNATVVTDASGGFSGFSNAFGGRFRIALSGDGKSLLLTYDPPAKALAFTSTAVSFEAGTLSGVITIQRRDGAGAAVSWQGNLTVTLSSDSATGEFRSADDSAAISSITIASGASSASFRYRDTTPGSPVLSASASGLTTGTQAASVGKHPQSITFTSPGNQPYGSTWTPAASASSGLSVTFSVVSGPASHASGQVSFTGVGSVTVRASQAGDANYLPASADVTFTVVKATPVITWSDPAGITYGTALGAAQLNATANTAGTFTYSPTAGTVLGAGARTLQVTFTPSNSTLFNSANASVPLEVAKASQTITFGALGNKPYGRNVSLGATASSGLGASYAVVSGPASLSGNVLTPTGLGDVTVRASQTGNANYEAAPDVEQTFTIVSGTPVITWATPANISYGTALGAAQLNATADAAGSFVYSPSAGDVLDVGSHTLSASFTPTDTAHYGSASADVTLTVVKASQTITFSAPADRPYGSASFAPGATASSGLDVTVDVVSGPAAMESGLVKITGAGTVTLRASQAGSLRYEAAASVDRSFTVTKRGLTVTAADASRAFGAANPSFSGTISGLVADDNITASYAAVAAPSASTPPTFASSVNVSRNYHAVSSSGDLYVTDGNNFVYRFDAAGSFQGAWGGYGTAPGRFNINHGIAVDGEGSVYVADYLNHRIQKFTSTGSFIREFGNSGGPGQLLGPRHVAVDQAGNVFVIGSENGARVFQFTKDGAFVRMWVWGSEYNIYENLAYYTPYMIWETAGGLAVDNSGNVYVSIQTGSVSALKVKKFTADGNPLASWGIFGSQPGQFGGSAEGIAVDARGNVFVVDGGYRWVNKYAPDGSFLTRIGNSSVFGNPNRLAADGAGDLWVGDGSSIKKFSAPPPAAVDATTLPGTYPIVPAVSDPDGRLSNYDVTIANGALTITKAQPAITWNQPASIPFGTALSGAQLNASAGVAGAFAYTPAGGSILSLGDHTLSVEFSPTDTARYRTSSAQVTLTITANQAPVAQGQSLTIDEDTAVEVPLAASDAEGNAITAFAVSKAPSQGSTSFVDGRLYYQPAADFNGSDSFEITASDAYGTSAPATVQVTVNPVDDLPVVVSDTVVRARDSGLKVRRSQLLANDRDPDDTLAVLSVSPYSLHGGTVELEGPWVLYYPWPDYNGSDTFTYTVTDGHGHTAEAMVTVTVGAGGSEPTLNQLSVEVLAGGGVRVRFMGIPGQNYVIQSTTSLSPASWIDEQTVTADAATGLYEFVDAAVAGSKYYRAVKP